MEVVTDDLPQNNFTELVCPYVIKCLPLFLIIYDSETGSILDLIRKKLRTHIWVRYGVLSLNCVGLER